MASKILKQLNHYPEFKTAEGIQSVIKFIRSGTFPLLNKRQGNTFRTRYSNPDFKVKQKNGKQVLYYNPNDDMSIEVINPNEKQDKLKEIYDDEARGLGTGLLAFYHQVAMYYLPITKAETDAFLKKQGDFIVNRKPHDVINRPILATVPNERWGMDITYFDRYPANINGGHIYLFVCIDYFSGKMWARGLKSRTNDTNEHEIVDAFDSICKEADTNPHIVQSDHEFTKGALKVYCKDKGIRQYKTTSYSPVSNGKVERMNRTIRGKVKAIMTRNNNLVWFTYLKDIVKNINSQQSARTGFTADQLWRPKYTPAAAVAPPQNVHDHSSRNELVSHNINLNRVRAIRQASETPERIFNGGDLVRIRMTKFGANNIYRKAKEGGIGWSYVGVHYTPEVFRVSIAHHHNRFTSPERDSYFLQTLDGRNVMASSRANVPMKFYGNDLIRVPDNHIKTHITPNTGDASIRQANYLNRLIDKKPRDSPMAQPTPQSIAQPMAPNPPPNPPPPNPPPTAPRTRTNTTLTSSDESPIRFQQKNPKKVGTMSYERYELYKKSKSIQAAIQAGATRGDIKWDKGHGYVRNHKG